MECLRVRTDVSDPVAVVDPGCYLLVLYQADRSHRSSDMRTKVPFRAALISLMHPTFLSNPSVPESVLTWLFPLC